MASSEISSAMEDLTALNIEINNVPSSLKFLISNLKSLVNNPLSTDNYPILRSQILKVFSANGFHGILDGTNRCPSNSLGSNEENSRIQTWRFLDQTLASAIYSTVSPSILPYIITLETCAEIWTTLERRLQPSNRSRVIQLKNELHHIALNNRTMDQYLTDVKKIADGITAAGATIDSEDIILYILNGLPATYHAFKTSIRTTLNPISLDDFNSLLCSEEIHVNSDISKEHKTESQVAFYTNKGHNPFYRGRGRNSRARSRNSGFSSRGGRSNIPNKTTCQICQKQGHNAFDCWHRSNMQYTPNSANSNPTALITNSRSTDNNWYLDSGSTSHLTANIEQLYQPQLYKGNEQVKVGNGSSIPISHSGKGNSSNTAKTVLIITLPVAFALAFLCLSFILLLRRKRAFKRLPTGHLVQKENMRSIESLIFDLDTIRNATNDFSEENKLGEGGFGPVYKGLLEDGQWIAVKRLSRTSTQGFVEMKTEVALVAKLQHKNLVRLLGCCLEHNEKMLIYEYLPKTSLDNYLFDPAERTQLDWGTRYKIIEGIGRGLVYLHEDSRLKIIHRDLKASNILLDSNMTPKISDFGLARLFRVDQTQQNTNKIAGTFGYMAPEYALHGLFSTKSDVFSYGVLILEIITGRRNTVFTDIGHPLDLLSYVWKYWNQGTPLQVIDQCLGHNYQSQEVLRCLHIGLLCVQDDSLLRPSMASVMLMISSHSTTVPAPSTPPFYVGGSSYGDSESSARETQQNISENEQLRAASANSVTITDAEAR